MSFYGLQKLPKDDLTYKIILKKNFDSKDNKKYLFTVYFANAKADVPCDEDMK